MTFAVKTDREILCQLQGSFLTAQSKEAGSEINHISVPLTGKAMEPPVHLHAGMSVIVKRTTGHPVPSYWNPIKFRSLSCRDRLLYCFKYIRFPHLQTKQKAPGFLRKSDALQLHILFFVGAIRPSRSHRSRFFRSASNLPFASFSLMDSLAFFLICSLPACLTSGFSSTACTFLRIFSADCCNFSRALPSRVFAIFTTSGEFLHWGIPRSFGISRSLPNPQAGSVPVPCLSRPPLPCHRPHRKHPPTASPHPRF